MDFSPPELRDTEVASRHASKFIVLCCSGHRKRMLRHVSLSGCAVRPPHRGPHLPPLCSDRAATRRDGRAAVWREGPPGKEIRLALFGH